jgi:hypothetical protein
MTFKWTIIIVIDLKKCFTISAQRNYVPFYFSVFNSKLQSITNLIFMELNRFIKLPFSIILIHSFTRKIIFAFTARAAEWMEKGVNLIYYLKAHCWVAAAGNESLRKSCCNCIRKKSSSCNGTFCEMSRIES